MPHPLLQLKKIFEPLIERFDGLLAATIEAAAASAAVEAMAGHATLTRLLSSSLTHRLANGGLAEARVWRTNIASAAASAAGIFKRLGQGVAVVALVFQ